VKHGVFVSTELILLFHYDIVE